MYVTLGHNKCWDHSVSCFVLSKRKLTSHPSLYVSQIITPLCKNNAKQMEIVLNS